MTLPSFPAFQHRNFRLFLFGQLISLTGVWAQRTAQSWLVYELTNSPAWLGLIDASTMFPMMIFSLLGGSFADRYPKKRMLSGLYGVMMGIATIYALSIFSGIISIGLIAALSVSIGTMIAFEVPTRQSFYVELVGRKDLPNAIALNSAAFNMARLTGPAIGGFLVAQLGVGWCMALNAASYSAILVMLLLIREGQPDGTPHVADSLRKSFGQLYRYVRANRQIRALLLLVAITTVFGWSYIVLFPVFAKEILGGGAVELGNLLSAAGLGAFIAAVLVASLSERILPIKLSFIGLAVFLAGAGVFAVARVFSLALIGAALAGAGLIAFYVNVNSALQRRVPHALRGRIMGMYALSFGGLMPVGSLQVGFMAEYLGVRTAILIGLIFLTIAAAIIMSQISFELPQVEE